MKRLIERAERIKSVFSKYGISVCEFEIMDTEKDWNRIEALCAIPELKAVIKEHIHASKLCFHWNILKERPSLLE